MFFNAAVIRVAYAVLLFGTSIFAAAPSPNSAKIRRDFGNVPIYFEANQGQADPSLRYLARGSGLRAAVRQDGLTLSAHGRSASMRILGASSKAALIPEERVEGISNYYLGSHVITGLQHYRRVRANGILPGIDVSYYGSGHDIEYDFVIHQGADPNAIRMKFYGGAKPAVDANGDLVLQTELGEMRQRRPRVWQEIGGTRREVSCRYRVDRSGEVRLTVGRFDRARGLTIDPILSVSTYLGGTADDNATRIAVDASGNIYVAGYTESTDFPATSGNVATGDSYDVFVTKLNPAGTSIVYSTIIGGTGDDRANAIALDSAGNAYVAGYTWSATFPNTTGVPGGGQDAFAVKLGSSGNLIYSNVFGGSINDIAYAIAVDSTGSAYVAGTTASNNFPVVGTPLRTGLGGSYDAFIAKLTPAGAMSYSKNFGGQGQDGASAIAIDSSGNAYVAGSTTSSDFPATGFQTANRASDGTTFVSVINPSGTGYVYSTYLGGSLSEWATGIAVDATGSAYVTGTTSSSDFPTTPSSFIPTKPNGNSGTSAGFITKLDPTGATLVYSSYLGGSANEGAGAVAVDSHGSVYVTGSSQSSDFPTTPGALKRTKTTLNNDIDAFMVQVAPDGGALSYSTLLGSGGSDVGTGIALDQNGGVYIAGITTSSTLPTTINAYQAASPKGSIAITDYTVFVAKIDLGSPTMCSTSVSPTSVTLPGTGGTFSFNLTVPPGCPWDTSADSFITLTSAPQGMGSSSPIPITGSVGVNLDLTNSISGVVRINGATFTVNQGEVSCADPVFDPTSASFDMNGGVRTIGITLPSPCRWNVVSSAPWISVTTNSSGSGSGSTTIYASATSFSQRTATLTIAGKTIPVTQTGSTCTATSSATGTSFPGAGGTGLVQIAPNAQSCAWTSYSLVSWIQVMGSGRGSGTTSFFVAPNPGSVSRMGGILIGDQTVNITQSAGPAGTFASYTATVFAGTGNSSGPLGDGGPATSASLSVPSGIAFDPAAGALYIADFGNNRVRVVTPDGNINTFAGGGSSTAENIAPTAAALTSLFAVAVDSTGAVYVSENWSRVRKISQGRINTVAGTMLAGFGGDNGPATQAQLNAPQGLAVDADGNLFISDTFNFRIREVRNGTITTFAGGGLSGLGDGGAPTNATLAYPQQIVFDSAGNLLIADTNDNRIRKVANNIITTVAGGGSGGDGGPATSANIINPTGVTLDSMGNLFLSQQAAVRKVDANGILSTVFGSWFVSSAPDLAADNAGNLYLSATAGSLIYKLTPVPTFCTFALGPASVQSGSGGPASITVTTNPGCGWNATSPLSWVTVNSPSGTGSGSASISIAANTGAARSGTIYVAGQAVTISQVAAPLGFFTLTPCRIADTRLDQGKPAPFGQPALIAGATRDFPLLSSACNIPAQAQAYSLNFTVVPPGPLSFLSVWQSGQPYPNVSTLNSPLGATLANSAIVPAGANGAITTLASQNTHLIIDTNGYFAPPNGYELAFYPVTPCRIADTRSDQGKTGAYGPPALNANATRDFPIAASACGIPLSAEAYSLNMTVIPQGRLDYLSTWPAGEAYPGVSTLNSSNGATLANAAIVPAGNNGSITVLAGNPTDLIIDINGYFGAPGNPGALHFYPVTPCRVADTRSGQGKPDPFGPPALVGGSTRDFPIPQSACDIPVFAQAYSLNVTAVPSGALQYLSIWPAGQPYPNVSTLNSPWAAIIANAAIVPAGTNGAITVLAGNPTDLIIDINGYFAP